MERPIEVVFYIHGVSGDRLGRSHLTEYRALHEGVRSRRDEYPESYGGAEWGWNPSGEQGNSHQLLTQAQSMLGERANQTLRQTRDLTLNPLRLAVAPIRELFLFSFGDMFYYVSQGGKQAVRSRIAEQLNAHLQPFLANQPDRLISLTLLGHSAGSVIAFDFAFSLFQKCKSDHQFLKAEEPNVSDQSVDLFHDLRTKATAGQLRLRRLITFGSPITPLAFRSDPVVEILASGKRLDPSDYGFTTNPDGFPALDGPRWINVWDKDDLIGWPVEPLMEPAPAGTQQPVKDVYLDVSDRLSKAHDAYWYSHKMHRRIAELW